MLGADERRESLPDEWRQRHCSYLAPSTTGEPVAVLAADDDQGALGVQCSPQPRHAVASSDVENQVVLLAAVGEVGSGVVDHMVGAERADEIKLRRAGHPGYFGSECLGQLNRIGADATGGTEDQHPLTGLHVPNIGQRLQRGDT